MWNKLLAPVCVVVLMSGVPAAHAADAAVAAAPKPQAAPAIVMPVPETNPYSLLLIALGMLGFTARREKNEIFSDTP